MLSQGGCLDGPVWSRLLLLQYCGIPLILGRLTECSSCSAMLAQRSRAGPIGRRGRWAGWPDGDCESAQCTTRCVRWLRWQGLAGWQVGSSEQSEDRRHGLSPVRPRAREKHCRGCQCSLIDDLTPHCIAAGTVRTCPVCLCEREQGGLGNWLPCIPYPGTCLVELVFVFWKASFSSISLSLSLSIFAHSAEEGTSVFKLRYSTYAD